MKKSLLLSTLLISAVLVGCNKPAKSPTVPVTQASPEIQQQVLEQLLSFAEKGDRNAQFELGAFYHDAEGGTKDTKKALEWFSKAAAQGEPRAQFNLGVMYYEGEGVTQDYAQAKTWFEKAAAQGNARAQFNLGVMYYRGEGMKQDFVKALGLFKLASMQNFQEAQFNLGVMYTKGEGTQPDSNLAYAWFALAAKAGSTQAADLVKTIEKQLTPADLAKAKQTMTDLEKEIAKNVAAANAASSVK